ncbi:MAG: HupE/UreJ family protein [Flavobacteriales bacterium]
MSFGEFLVEGALHIADLRAFDHILFIVALAVVFDPRDWRKLFGLVTAFTIGHSITLALVSFDYQLLPSKWVEFFIPVTILLTSIMHLFALRRRVSSMSMGLKFIVVLLFGLIHGMGFSPYLKMLVGKDDPIALPLFAFNIGVEIGQLLILLCFFIISGLIYGLTRVKHREWSIFVLGGTSFLSLVILIENWPW